MMLLGLACYIFSLRTMYVRVIVCIYIEVSFSRLYSFLIRTRYVSLTFWLQFYGRVIIYNL